MRREDQTGLFFEEDTKHRVHRCYIWVGPIGAAIGVLVALGLMSYKKLVQFYDFLAEKGLLGDGYFIGMFIAALIGIYVLLVICFALYRHTLFYEFGRYEFRRYAGTIIKQDIRLPYENVQSVNHQATMLQRLFGVCTVVIDTAGGVKNRSIRIPYVTLEASEQICGDLFAHKRDVLARREVSAVVAPTAATPAAAATMAASKSPRMTKRRVNVVDRTIGPVGNWRGIHGGKRVPVEPASYEFGLTNSELLLTAISRSSSAVVSVVGATAGAGVSIAGGFGILPVILTALGFWLLNVAGICLAYGDYRVSRRGTRIDVERGLLRRMSSSIDVDHVQSVMIRQSFMRRILGYAEVSVGRVATIADKTSRDFTARFGLNRLVIHPFVKVSRIDAVLADLLPELGDRPMKTDVIKPPRAAKSRAFVRKGVTSNLAIPVVLFALYLRAIIRYGYYGGLYTLDMSEDLIALLFRLLDLCCLVLAIVGGVLTVAYLISALIWYRDSGFALGRDVVEIFNGGLLSERVIIPRDRIQQGYVSVDPFQRRGHLTTISAVTPAGLRRTTTRLHDVSEDAGGQWMEWFQPKA